MRESSSGSGGGPIGLYIDRQEYVHAKAGKP